MVMPMVVFLLILGVTFSGSGHYTKCEIIWCKLNIIGCRALYLGSFYRPQPSLIGQKKYLERLSVMMSNKNAHGLVGVTLIVGILIGAP